MLYKKYIYEIKFIIIIITVLINFKLIGFFHNEDCLIKNIDVIKYDINVLKEPLIFVGGFERSGTTLMRAILDVHDSVSCGPETKIIPRALFYIYDTFNNSFAVNDLRSSGVIMNTVNEALGMFIYHIMNNHIRRAKRLCAKDPVTFKRIDYLHKIFPNAKFIYMVRNGRASTYSLLKKLKSNNFTTYMNLLKYWNKFNNNTYRMCQEMGPNYCKLVKYEDLVMKKVQVLKSVIEFLDLEWSDRLLNHQKYINDKIFISNMEWSNDQINKPIYTESLENWKGKINGYNEELIKEKITMLRFFGY